MDKTIVFFLQLLVPILFCHKAKKRLNLHNGNVKKTKQLVITNKS